jgi:hypothetical protein
MAKPKSKNKKPKHKKIPRKPKAKPVKEKAPKEKPAPKEKLDPRIEEVYEREITFTCPVRGLVTQKVKVKRYKPLGEQSAKPIVNSANELVNALEEKDSGLSIYDSGEELGVTDIPSEEIE